MDLSSGPEGDDDTVGQDTRDKHVEEGDLGQGDEIITGRRVDPYHGLGGQAELNRPDDHQQGSSEYRQPVHKPVVVDDVGGVGHERIGQRDMYVHRQHA